MDARTQAVLKAILPPSPELADAIRLHSGGALAIVDRWLGTRTVSALDRIDHGFSRVRHAFRVEDNSLVALLVEPAASIGWTGIDDIKALLIVGNALGRIESRLSDTVATGARKSPKSVRWRALLPPKQAGQPDFAATIAFCKAHAKKQLGARADKSKGELDWLEALKRWCEFLESPSPSPALRWLQSPNVHVAETTQTQHDGAESTAIEVAISWVDEWSSDEPPEQVEIEGGEAEAVPPASDAPEAPATHPRAPPPREVERETPECGEARGARTGFRSALENQYLPWVNDQLVDRDLDVLMAEIRSALAAGDQNDADSAGLVGLALVTGMLVEAAVALPMHESTGRSHLSDCRYLVRSAAPASDAWRPNDQQLQLLRAHTDVVRLQLPQEISRWLQSRTGSRSTSSLGDVLQLSPVQARTAVRDWLNGVRQRTSGLQVLGRIERWLAGAIYRKSHDHVCVHLLCADAGSPPCPASYYRAYPLVVLEDLHAEVLRTAGWTIELEGTRARADDAWVGTRLNPAPAVVAELWAATREHFERIVLDMSQPLDVRHNAREAHEVLSLVFQTFHRAVSDPIESLSLLDLDDGRMLIDDKQQGEARAHRLVPLGTLAVRQCKSHIEHLWRLAGAVTAQAPDTARRIVAMLTNPQAEVIPFRFFLDADLKIVRITPGGLRARLDAIWTLPLNLGRRFGATWLIESGASDAQVTSLLGHHDLGTIDLSILSPRSFDDLFAGCRKRLDAMTEALGMKEIATFIEPSHQAPSTVSKEPLPPAMSFGHGRRAKKRDSLLQRVAQDVDQWISEQLGDRPRSSITQGDVNALFDMARRKSPNGRTHWARQRFEALRDALVALLREYSDLYLELPAIFISIRDVAHLCPMDALISATWLVQLRRSLQRHWAGDFGQWRKAQSQAYLPEPTIVLLTVIVESLVIDPDCWNTWLTDRRPFNVFRDQGDQSWLRMPLPNGNSRLYPLASGTAELLARLDTEALRSVKLDQIARAANKLAPAAHGASASFGQLMSRLYGGAAVDVSGLVLGYANGACGSVSVEEMCLERFDGNGPTEQLVQAWHDDRLRTETAIRKRSQPLEAVDQKGRITSITEFRNTMADALALLGDRRGRKPATEVAPVVNVAPKAKESRLGPIGRFAARLHERWNDLVASPSLPPICSLVVRWMGSLASDGKADGDPYAPKTLRNYWYSWALRLVEELEDVDPVDLAPEELEDLYLQIIDEAVLVNREHLYAPMRNFHKYLHDEHGVCEISWSALQAATDQGASRIDANIVYGTEYLKALDWLREDDHVGPRVRALQSTVLVLGYRCGMRINEVLGLRDTDVYRHNGRWHVRVTGNRFRLLKTNSSRRTIVIVEALEPQEEEALTAWSEHIRHFSSGRDVKPLFAAATTGQERLSLIPRRAIALRIGQALRLATCDPSTRVHHCRHSWATRLLLTGLGVPGLNSVPDMANRQANGSLTGALRQVLTSEADSSRRLVWAIAAMLGHASPATTLRSYFHGGHQLLARWHSTSWRVRGELDQVEWLAFASGVKLKSMQRYRQRASGDLSHAVAMDQWSSARQVGDGRRVQQTSSLPEISVKEGLISLVNADRVIDHVRRFGRADGLADALFVTEDWVEGVILAADAQARRWRLGHPEHEFCWIVDRDMIYGERQMQEIERALSTLSRKDRHELNDALQLLRTRLDPKSGMIAVESVDELERLRQLLEPLVDDKKTIRLLVPGRPEQAEVTSIAELIEQNSGGRNRASAQPAGHLRPRRSYVPVDGLAASGSISVRGAELGFSVEPYGRVVAARTMTHDRTRVGDRAGLSVRQNETDRLRSAKTLVRVLAVATVFDAVESGANSS